MSAGDTGAAAAGSGRPGVWRVEVERPGCGVHLIACEVDAVRLADAAPGNVWVERVDPVDARPLTAADVDRVIGARAW